METPATFDTCYPNTIYPTLTIHKANTGYPTLATSRLVPITNSFNSPADRNNVKKLAFSCVYIKVFVNFYLNLKKCKKFPIILVQKREICLILYYKIQIENLLENLSHIAPVSPTLYLLWNYSFQTIFYLFSSSPRSIIGLFQPGTCPAWPRSPL
jgi:hypothetical protein